jgi:hypothetical protein
MPKAKALSIDELHALIPRLTATAQALATLAGSARRGAAPSAGADGRRRGRGGAAASGKVQEKIIATLKRHKKGLSLGALIKAVGEPRNAVKYHLRALRALKKTRVAGDRRQARWFA